MNNLQYLLQRNCSPYPLLGENDWGQPYVFDFSSQSSFSRTIDTENFEEFQEVVFNKLKESRNKWGIGRYLEERGDLLRNYPQIVNEGRIYHMGLDVIVDGGTELFAPLDGEIFKVGSEEGKGNYGGYIVTKHQINDTNFYVFYGHLHDEHVVKEGESVKAGERFAIVGDKAEHSGGWFTHTHMQILTEEAMNKDKMLTGYLAESDLKNIENWFPNPYLLFRY